MTKKKYYLSISDVKKFLKRAEKDCNEATKVGLHELAESGAIDVRYSQQLQEVQAMAVKNYVKIATQLLTNMENFKKEENELNSKN